MPQDYFAPMRNALAGTGRVAELKYNLGQQRQQNALAQSQMQRENALADRKMRLNEASTIADMKKSQYDMGVSQRERLAEAQQLAATLAQRTLQAPPELQPALYQASSEMMQQQYGDVLGNEEPPPPWEEGGMQALQTLAGLAEQPDPYAGLDSGYETFLRANGMVNSPEAYSAYQQNVLEQKKAGATNVTTNVGGMTKGREEVDKTFANEYVQYVASGGFADTMKQVGQLRGVVDQLEKRDDLTGPLIGSVPDSIKKFTNPEAIATRESVEEVVQRNLRLVLGAQFTEKEGERLISRAYNPNLSEEENAKRLRRLLNQIEQAARSKKSAADYFQKNGTLKGWKGRVPKLDDFYEATAPKSASEYLKKFGGQ